MARPGRCDLPGASVWRPGGFVQRWRDPADRRRHIVELSERGTLQLASVGEKIAAVEGAVFAGVSAADLKVLRRALQLMAAGDVRREVSS